jgi:hypothetical protein
MVSTFSPIISGMILILVYQYLPQGDLPRDLGILSIVAKYNQVHVGVYASVERGGGIIHRVDTIQLEKNKSSCPIN